MHYVFIVHMCDIVICNKLLLTYSLLLLITLSLLLYYYCHYYGHHQYKLLLKVLEGVVICGDFEASSLNA